MSYELFTIEKLLELSTKILKNVPAIVSLTAKNKCFEWLCKIYPDP